jgi:hypothetical protein
VLGGTLASAGMASFADLLTQDEVHAIQAYLVREQRKLREDEGGNRRYATVIQKITSRRQRVFYRLVSLSDAKCSSRRYW